MNDKIFWDTNIAVYFATNTPGKLSVLQSVLSAGTEVVISTQVLNEFSNVAFRKLAYSALLQTGCTHLYSEDMHHGQTIDGLTIINPFR